MIILLEWKLKLANWLVKPLESTDELAIVEIPLNQRNLPKSWKQSRILIQDAVSSTIGDSEKSPKLFGKLIINRTLKTIIWLTRRAEGVARKLKPQIDSTDSRVKQPNLVPKQCLPNLHSHNAHFTKRFQSNWKWSTSEHLHPGKLKILNSN